MLADDSSQRNLNIESYKERITNFSNEFELGLFLFIIRRSLLWIFLCVLTALAAALVYLRYTAPIYESKAVVQLRASNTAKQVLEMSTFGEDNNLLADVELMRSAFFMAKVIKKMPIEVSYFNRGQILTEEFYTRSFFKVEQLTILNEKIRDIPIFLNFTNTDRILLSYTLGEETFNFDVARHQVIRTPHFSCIIKLTDPDYADDGDIRSALFMRINSTGSLISRFVASVQVQIADANAKTVVVS
ncbi:MAG: Wzz/FepE/Etk N-terminal domain-containing protein, partial [Flavobacteriales bacterium]